MKAISAAVLEDETYSGQADDPDLDADFSADNLDLNALLNEPDSEPSSEFAVDEFAIEAAPASDESDLAWLDCSKMKHIVIKPMNWV